jgi:hypothetical protein
MGSVNFEWLPIKHCVIWLPVSAVNASGWEERYETDKSMWHSSYCIVLTAPYHQVPIPTRNVHDILQTPMTRNVFTEVVSVQNTGGEACVVMLGHWSFCRKGNM